MEPIELLLCLLQCEIEGAVRLPPEIGVFPWHNEPARLKVRYQGDFAVARRDLSARRAKYDALQSRQEFLPHERDDAKLFLAPVFPGEFLFLADGANGESKEQRRR